MKSKKRLLWNAVFLLIIVAVAFAAYHFYAPVEPPIQGGTNAERALEIARRVTEDGKPYITVTSVQITKDDKGVAIRYVFFFSTPEEILEDLGAQGQSASAQGGMFGQSASAGEAEKAIKAYKSSILALLKLSMRHLVVNDPSIASVAILTHLPDGSVRMADVPVSQLARIGKNADDATWFEKFLSYSEGLKLVPEQEAPAK